MKPYTSLKKILFVIFTAHLCFSCNNTANNEENTVEANVQETKEIPTDNVDLLKSEFRVTTDLNEGIEMAREEEKPILLYFTGYAAINGRKIESELLRKNDVIFETMKNNYINVWLYVDDKKNGRQWLEYQQENFGTNNQPFFVILNPQGKPITEGLNYSEAKSELESILIEHKRI